LSRVERLYRRHAPVYDWTRRPFLVDRGRAVEALAIARGARVIDFACGTGLMLPLLRQAGAGDVTGVDLTPAMLERARRRDARARLVCGDLTEVSLDGPPADAAICAYGLSLVPDWPRALRNMHAHLRPGGTLVLLDFGRLRGLARAFDPALRLWLAAFGVRPALPVEAPLRHLFEDCRVEVRHAGWNTILRAAGARPGVPG
jgi:S-adenosylmethionine-diacylgycerolhomoserine-N-methlytransferase